MKGDWRRVTEREPCPVCSKRDWCAVSMDGSVALCQRVESAKRCGEGGWLHRLRDDKGWQRSRRVVQLGQETSAIRREQFVGLADRYARRATEGLVSRLADELGLAPASLRRLAVGWDGEAWTFPMRDADRRVVGIRRRLPNRRKLSVKGGREGLFIPKDLPDSGMLLVCEGPTDTAALLDLRFDAIGRPSCNGGAKHVVALAHGRDVVIVADADEPGQHGAQSLAATLQLYCPAVQIITPPDGFKDARAWAQAGATHADIASTIEAVEVQALTLKVLA